jgi:hypothetical protein
MKIKCPVCKEDRNPFVNKPKHKLYGICEECFNKLMQGKEDNTK